MWKSYKRRRYFQTRRESTFNNGPARTCASGRVKHPSFSEMTLGRSPPRTLAVALLYPELAFQANRKGGKWENVLFESSVTKPLTPRGLLPTLGEVL